MMEKYFLMKSVFRRKNQYFHSFNYEAFFPTTEYQKSFLIILMNDTSSKVLQGRDF